ncbi:uncharacterized protein LOC131680812 [Topomyia yanbarensis]|uniref:uncharacterized protein LOC131680812 n=1 Tax=Topomyia yanbarensis TaxID=2498891 RepID=UPI00273BDD98|nr:uncharacterized protein LOC131680812 [Topomyia yanbarensis]
MEKWDIPQFKYKSLPRNAIRDEWVKYKRNFGYIISATNETDKMRMRNILLAKGGPELQEVFASRPGADVTEDTEKTIDPYAVPIEKLDAYFSPKQHDAFERNRFWLLKPNPEETLEKFMLRWQDQANKCNFGKSAEESRSISVIDKVILFAPSELKEQLLQRDSLCLDEVTKIVTTYESVKQQHTEISTGFSNQMQKNARDVVVKDILVLTFPALPKEKSRKYDGPFRSGKRFQTDRINKVEVHRGDDHKEGVCSDNNFIFRISDGDELLWLKVGDVLLQVLVDSGCKKNIIDEKTWKYLKANCAIVWNQQKKYDEVFLPYGDQAKPLMVLGKFETLVHIEDAGRTYEKDATFYVVKGGQQCLLDRTTATHLGVLFVGLPSTYGVAMLETSTKHPFPKIKGVKVCIPIDLSIPPIYQHPRRPPIALTSRIEEKLNALLANNIIEPVEGGCQWVSPLVTVVKDNGDLRLSVDMRRANAAILRKRHLMPTIEDFLSRFTGAKFFSRLDIQEAFHKVELEEASRYITTFITHMGLFRYKLMYGIVIAPDTAYS